MVSALLRMSSTDLDHDWTFRGLACLGLVWNVCGLGKVFVQDPTFREAANFISEGKRQETALEIMPWPLLDLLNINMIFILAT